MATVSIPQPCPASWADMTPAPGGRHCGACNKIVVDFSAFSAAEVQQYLQRHPEACGRFQATHVGQAPVWAPWLAAALAALSSCKTEPFVVAPQAANTPVDATRHFLMRGTVVDNSTGRPLAQALVISEQDTTFLTHTAADGSFQLRLPLHLLGTRLVAAIENGKMPAESQELEGSYLPKYFPADNTTGSVVSLRNPGMIIGQAELASDECYSPVVMRYVMPPPPPPHLITSSFTAPVTKNEATE
ncbi:hypothetical protein [Hymenobacter canadensis]|uniref:Carboxypeptidase regulatory-like domain-containing protein n=1 Tax=Hymenobacter canadensis TaxID=2999067 RepID=A0ABY7LLD8_9BACT|nr:hypothetical protein [Hymenobacter canadensis]WBA41267.1 hypothetical protein O3303_15780 [Hymenobacter canadensis]